MKGKRCNPKGEFKKGHTVSLLQRKDLINQHHLDLDKQNNHPRNLFYLSSSKHNSLHKRDSYKARDKRRLKTYKKFGYKTLVIWDYEFQDIKVLKEKM